MARNNPLDIKIIMSDKERITEYVERLHAEGRREIGTVETMIALGILLETVEDIFREFAITDEEVINFVEPKEGYLVLDVKNSS